MQVSSEVIYLRKKKKKKRSLLYFKIEQRTPHEDSRRINARLEQMAGGKII